MRKTLLALSAAGGIGIASLCMQRNASERQEGKLNAVAEAPASQPPGLETVQTFLANHPEHQDAILTYIIANKEIQSNQYSIATLRTLGEAVEKNALLYPVTLESSLHAIAKATLRSPIGPKVFASLEGEEQFGYVKQFFKERALEYHERKYELINEWGETLGKEGEHFYDNVRRRVFGKE